MTGKPLIFRSALIAFFVMSTLPTFGCTARTVYDSLQYRQGLECEKLQGTTEREDCRRRSGMSYDEYQRRVNEREKDRGN